MYRVNKLSQEYAEGFVKLISCICPHLGEEMWEKLGHDNTIAVESWPTYDPTKLEVNTIKIAVQVNGKLRGELMVSPDESEDNLKTLALELDGVKRNIEGKEIKKIIVVKGRIINIVAI